VLYSLPFERPVVVWPEMSVILAVIHNNSVIVIADRGAMHVPTDGSPPSITGDGSKIAVLGADVVLGIVGRRVIVLENDNLDLFALSVGGSLGRDVLHVGEALNASLNKVAMVVQANLIPDGAGPVPGFQLPVHTAVLVAGVGDSGPTLELAAVAIVGVSEKRSHTQTGRVVLAPQSVQVGLELACDEARAMVDENLAVEHLIHAVRSAVVREVLLISPNLDVALIRNGRVEVRLEQMSLKVTVQRH
jgi:hypothetical protein